MQSVEDFMCEFFLARVEEEQRQQAMQAPFRRRFYAEGCEAGGRFKVLEMMRSEKVTDVEKSCSDAKVITIEENPFFNPPQLQRKRYNLTVAGDRWLIEFVEDECQLCFGRGDSKCLLCKGKHWWRAGLTAVVGKNEGNKEK